MTELGFRLIDLGHQLVNRIEEAEIVVINTCSVTSTTEAKTKRMIRRFSRQSPSTDICVTGCLCQHKAFAIKREPNVRWVIDNIRKSDIPEIIRDHREGVFCGPPAVSHDPLRLFPESSIFIDTQRRTRFSIKIQEGCDFRCAYCIVPSLRGVSRSATIEEILAVCRRAVEAGYKEIILTGTHIGQFRSGQGHGLAELMEQVANIPGDFRIRLSSLDPRDLSKGILDLIGENPRFCRHLHLSVQSFSPEVLAAMNRPSADITALIQTLVNFRKRFPEAGIGGDFIVGFPGETENNFYETLETIEKIGFSYGHVFRFSKRPLTPAADFGGQIGEKEKNRRSECLREVLDRCHETFVRENIGARCRIIVEKESPAAGRTSNYLVAEIPGASAAKNTWLGVTIQGINPLNGHCRAAIVESGVS